MSTPSPDDIVRAALRVVADRGMAATTYRAVAAEAAASLGAVQRAFPSRADLVAAMVARLRESAPDLPTTEPGRPTLTSWLIELTMAILPISEAARRVALQAAAIGSIALHDPDAAAGVRAEDARMRGLIASLVERAIAEGEVDRAVDPTQVARILHAMVSGLTDQLIAEPQSGEGLEPTVAFAIERLLGTQRIPPESPA